MNSKQTKGQVLHPTHNPMHCCGCGAELRAAWKEGSWGGGQQQLNRSQQCAQVGRSQEVLSNDRRKKKNNRARNKIFDTGK